MDYRSLGRTGVQVSALCLGCMMFGRRTSAEDSYTIIDRALDAGINFLDTANVYGRGRSEEIVGEALKRNGKRHDVILATKVHGRMADEEPNAWGNSRRHIIEQCEASLHRLQTDTIDLYQIHRPQSEIPIDETIRALDDLVRAGKVRYIGTSTFAAWQLVEALWVSKELGLNRFVTEQQPYNILDRRVERELMPMARTYGIATIPWSPLAGGMLTGKYRRGEELPANSRYAQPDIIPRIRQRFHEGIFDVVEAIASLAQRKGCSSAQYALAWCLSQPGVTSPIIGPRTMEHLEDNLGALDVRISEDDVRAIDELVPPGTMISNYYEADFGPHLFRW